MRDRRQQRLKPALILISLAISASAFGCGKKRSKESENTNAQELTLVDVGQEFSVNGSTKRDGDIESLSSYFEFQVKNQTSLRLSEISRTTACSDPLSNPVVLLKNSDNSKYLTNTDDIEGYETRVPFPGILSRGHYVFSVTYFTRGSCQSIDSRLVLIQAAQ
jgi:hypothetical protein